MTAPTTENVTELESLYDEELQCFGMEYQSGRRRPCQSGQPVRWLSRGHGQIGSGCDAGEFKCESCYARWRSEVEDYIDYFGSIGCDTCRHEFTTPDQFSRHIRI